MIAPSVILPFDGPNSAIPAGFTRDTRFDSKYIKVTTSDWGNTGGSATHTHTGSHTHTYSNGAHTHSVSSYSTPPAAVTNGKHQDAPNYDITATNHVHGSTTSGSMIEASITNATSTIGNANNNYSKYDLIFIKSNSYNLIPQNAVIFRNDTSSRASTTHFDALNDKYIRGASAGADAGNATTVATHNHTQSHSHTASHKHNDAISGNVPSGKIGTNNTGSTCTLDHTHTVYFATNYETMSNSTALPSFTNDLAYKELHPWKTSSNIMPIVGDIAFSTETEVPIGWSDLGYSDIYIKGKTQGSSLTTGGSNTHTHSGISHSHTGGSHTHTFTTSAYNANRGYTCCSDASLNGSHSHTGTTETGTNSSTGTTNLTFNTVNHEPVYIKVKLIQFEFPPVIPNPILMMMVDTVENWA